MSPLSSFGKPFRGKQRKPTGARPRGRRSAFAFAVLVLPFLLVNFLTNDGTAPASEPEVTRILREITDPAAGEGPVARDSGRKHAGGDAPVTRGKAVPITFERGRRTPVGTMKIPAIDLKTNFFEGVVDEAVEKGPGHWPGTPWPGKPGNSVFAGHRTTHTHPFRDLDLLSTGDRVIAKGPDGTTTTYRVFRTAVVPEAEYVDYVLRQPQDKKTRVITLFACAPKGSRTHRIVVLARAKESAGRRTPESEAMPLVSQP